MLLYRHATLPDRARMTATFLALGDSYTIGEGVDTDASWPAQLTARLRAAGYALDDPEIIATTGWTTDELAAAIVQRVPAASRALVSLQIGVNNQYRGRSLDEYREQFSALLEQALAFASQQPRHVIVVSIPDWGVTPFAAAQAADSERIGREVDAFNAAARAITKVQGAHWIDITDLSRGVAREILAADGLHPSADQYSLWVSRIEVSARAALGLPTRD